MSMSVLLVLYSPGPSTATDNGPVQTSTPAGSLASHERRIKPPPPPPPPCNIAENEVQMVNYIVSDTPDINSCTFVGEP
jgi:hypothetical protein